MQFGQFVYVGYVFCCSCCNVQDWVFINYGWGVIFWDVDIFEVGMMGLDIDGFFVGYICGRGDNEVCVYFCEGCVEIGVGGIIYDIVKSDFRFWCNQGCDYCEGG